MKTDFLKELGIDDQETINRIMAENGRDIEKAKGNLEELQHKVDSLQTQLSERDTQLTELKKTAGDNTKLTQRITELEEANAATSAEYESKLATMRKEHEIESKLRDANAKNLKAVRGFIDPEKDLDEQIEALISGEDTAFLFNSKEPEPKKASGYVPVEPGNPKPAEPHATTFLEAVQKSLGKK